jgi:hypothetical protein
MALWPTSGKSCVVAGHAGRAAQLHGFPHASPAWELRGSYDLPEAVRRWFQGGQKTNR